MMIKAYSYKDDPAVPDFPDDRPLILIDGYCALCSGGMVWLLRRDRNKTFRIATIQSKAGRALYIHYGKDPDHFDTYTLIVHGKAYFKTDGYIETMRQLGGIWKVLTMFRLVPKFIRDAIYDFLDRNRIQWFGKTDYCALIPKEEWDRVLKD